MKVVSRLLERIKKGLNESEVDVLGRVTSYSAE